MSEYGVAGEADWDDDSGSSGGGGGGSNNVEMLKLTENVQYTVRLVGKPYKFWKHYSPINAVSPGEKHDVAWQQGHKPKKRYAIWLIDRADGKMKVLEFGPVIYKRFKSYRELKNENPGGKNGPDWIIKKTIPEKFENGKMVKSNRNTEYSIERDEVAVFTEEESKMIKETLMDSGFKWSDVLRFKPSTPEYINKLFEESKTLEEGDPVPGSYQYNMRKREQKAQEGGSTEGGSSAETSAPAQATADTQGAFDDLFTGDESSEGDSGDGSADLF
jgi:hypothetical protein